MLRGNKRKILSLEGRKENEGSKRKAGEGRKEGRKEQCRHVSSYIPSSCPEPRLEAAILRDPGGFEPAPKSLAVTEKYHVTSKGDLCRSFCFQIGGAAHPQSPRLLCNSMHASFSFHFYMVFILFLMFIIFIVFHHFSSLLRIHHCSSLFIIFHHFLSFVITCPLLSILFQHF